MTPSIAAWKKTVAVAAVAAVALVSAGCADSTTPGAVTTGSSDTHSSAAATSATSAKPGTVQCAYPDARAASKPAVKPSGDDIAATGTVDVVMHMDAGDVALTLDRAGAPCAVNSFESLAKQGYFDNTSCHRLVSDFVLQCGDPSGTGAGGPGYSFADELSGKETYPYATVAMANAGPNTNGSQFFIVIGDKGQTLPADYDVLGTVDADSMKVVDAIAAQGVDPSDPQGIKPAEGGHIVSVTAS